MKTPDFNIDYLDGKKAESIACNIFKAMGFRAFECNGIEYDIQIVKDNKVEYVEVKYDIMMAKTGNFFFELMSNMGCMNIGAGLNGKSDYFAILTDSGDQEYMLRVIPTRLLRALAISGMLKNEYKTKTVRGNEQCIGLAIPIDDIVKLSIFNCVWNNKRKEMVKHSGDDLIDFNI